MQIVGCPCVIAVVACRGVDNPIFAGGSYGRIDCNVESHILIEIYVRPIYFVGSVSYGIPIGIDDIGFYLIVNLAIIAVVAVV